MAGFGCPPRSFRDDEIVEVAYLSGLAAHAEERIVAALEPLGPVVAIGRPGESQPELGATRFYVRDEHWQQAVLHLLPLSKVVLVVPGATEGIGWEVEQALALVPPERILLHLPYAPPADLQSSSFRWRILLSAGGWFFSKVRRRVTRERELRYAQLRERLARSGVQLPPHLGKHSFLDFDLDGRARLLPRRHSLWRRLASLGLIPRFEVSPGQELKPFLEKIRHLPPPPLVAANAPDDL